MAPPYLSGRGWIWALGCLFSLKTRRPIGNLRGVFPRNWWRVKRVEMCSVFSPHDPLPPTGTIGVRGRISREMRGFCRFRPAIWRRGGTSSQMALLATWPTPWPGGWIGATLGNNGAWKRSTWPPGHRWGRAVSWPGRAWLLRKGKWPRMTTAEMDGAVPRFHFPPVERTSRRLRHQERKPPLSRRTATGSTFPEEKTVADTPAPTLQLRPFFVFNACSSGLHLRCVSGPFKVGTRMT